jgi:hypothetical protein
MYTTYGGPSNINPSRETLNRVTGGNLFKLETVKEDSISKCQRWLNDIDEPRYVDYTLLNNTKLLTAVTLSIGINLV